MQEVNTVLKSLHELEFLFCYHRHILTTNKCSCDNFVQDANEFNRVYLKMRNLSIVLRKEICKTYNENLKLKKRNVQLMKRLNEPGTAALGQTRPFLESNQNICDELGQKFYKFDKDETRDCSEDTSQRENTLADLNSTSLLNYEIAYARPARNSLNQLFFSNRNINEQSTADNVSTEIHLFKSESNTTTTIGQTMGETESSVGIYKNNNVSKKDEPFYLKRHYPKMVEGSSSSSSFDSSGYYSANVLLRKRENNQHGKGHQANKRFSAIEPNISLPLICTTPKNRSFSSNSLMQQPRQSSDNSSYAQKKFLSRKVQCIRYRFIYY